MVTPSLAAPGSVHLDYRAPLGCGTEAEVLREFHALLGEHAEVDPLEASAVVIARDNRLLLEFHATYRGTKSQRVLELEDCEGATEAAAVLLLLTVDPLLAADLGKALDATVPPPATTTEAPPPPPEPTVTESTPPPAPPPAPNPLPEKTAPPRPKWLALGPSLRSGSSPGLAVGGTLEGGVSVGFVDVTVGISTHYGVPQDLAEVEGGQVDGLILSGQARGKLPVRTKPLDFGPSLSVGFDRLSLATTGVSSPGSGATQWLWLGAGVFARRQLSPEIGLELQGGAVVPLERPTYGVEGIGAVHRPVPVAFESLLAISWHWNSQS